MTFTLEKLNYLYGEYHDSEKRYVEQSDMPTVVTKLKKLKKLI